jgi:hypothetical protein
MMHSISFVSQAMVADLFTTIQGVEDADADLIATLFVAHSESGDYYPEMIWDWMTARGIDPEQIRAETEAEIAASKITETNNTEKSTN